MFIKIFIMTNIVLQPEKKMKAYIKYPFLLKFCRMYQFYDDTELY
jgi:hypothetical protein